MRWILACGIGVGLVVLAGCKTAEKSADCRRHFRMPAAVKCRRRHPKALSSFLAKHEDLRKQLTPLCNAQRAKAPADWSTSDEGKICTANERANFFGKPQLKSDGVKF